MNSDIQKYYLDAIISTLLCLIVVRGYIAFFQIFHPQNHFIVTLPFYQNEKLEPTPTFAINSSILGFFDFTGNRKLLRQDRTLFKNKRNRNNRTYKHFTYQGKNKLHYLNTIQCSLLFSNKSTCCEITQFYFQNYDCL